MAIALNKIVVLGGGSWGTALALAAARAGREVIIWARNVETVNAINTSKQNPKYLPGIEWTEQITATNSLKEAVSEADAVLLVTPAQTTRVMMEEIKSFLKPATPVACAQKASSNQPVACSLRLSSPSHQTPFQQRFLVQALRMMLPKACQRL